MVRGLNLSNFLEGNNVPHQFVDAKSAQVNSVNPKYLQYDQQDQLTLV